MAREDAGWRCCPGAERGAGDDAPRRRPGDGCCPGAEREAAPLLCPWGSRFGDVTSGRIVRGGLARIELGRIPSRWARTARGGVDFVALGSHCASRTRPAPTPGPGISLSGAGITQAGPPRPGPGPVGRIRAGPKVDGVLVVAAGGRDDVNRARVIGAGVSSLRLCGSSRTSPEGPGTRTLIAAPVRVLEVAAVRRREVGARRRARVDPCSGAGAFVGVGFAGGCRRAGCAPAAGAARSVRSPGRRRDRRVTLENVPLVDVLAGQVTCSRVIRRSCGPGRDESGWGGNRDRARDGPESALAGTTTDPRTGTPRRPGPGPARGRAQAGRDRGGAVETGPASQVS